MKEAGSRIDSWPERLVKTVYHEQLLASVDVAALFSVMQ